MYMYAQRRIIAVCATWQSDQSSLGSILVVKDKKHLRLGSEDYDQTVPMRRLIWVFLERTCQKVHFRTLRLIYLQAQHFKAIYL